MVDNLMEATTVVAFEKIVKEFQDNGIVEKMRLAGQTRLTDVYKLLPKRKESKGKLVRRRFNRKELAHRGKKPATNQRGKR